MLMVIMCLCFVLSHLVLRECLLAVGSLENATLLAPAVLCGYAGAVLAFAKLSTYLPLPNPHVPVSFALGALIGMFFWALRAIEVQIGLGPMIEDDPRRVALLLVFFLVWGWGAQGLASAVLGSNAVREHWEYVRRVYSTFRRD